MTGEERGDLAEMDAALSITVVDRYEALSRLAADIVAEIVANDPSCALTLPTGETPLGMYQELVRRINDGRLDFSQAHLFCLDDYLGQTPDDQASLTGWLKQAFLEPANLPVEHIHYIPTTAADSDAAAERYEADIRAHGGLALAVVGLGPNGHVAFNEPGSGPETRTRVVELTEESRDQSAAYWEGEAEIPRKAITMGIGTILSAKRVVLIVSGTSKAEIVRQALEGPMTSDVPGSWLRLAEHRLEVILGREAASRLMVR